MFTKRYVVFRLLSKDTELRVVLGTCRVVLKLGRTETDIQAYVEYVTVLDIESARRQLRALAVQDLVLRTCMHNSTKLIGLILGIPPSSILNIPVRVDYYPYVESSPVEIVRKIAIVHMLFDLVLRRFRRRLSISETVAILHYLFRITSLNYNARLAETGRRLYEALVTTLRSAPP